MSSQPKLGTYPLARSVIDSVRLNFAVPSGRSRFFGSFTLLYLSKGGLISALQMLAVVPGTLPNRLISFQTIMDIH
jgi:hypothetical protein